jgi:hypothetical protein
MPTKHIDRDEYKVTIAELADRRERHKDGATIITGYHEDLGCMTLRRRFDVITEADGLAD